MEDHSQPIQVERVLYDKPVAVIYNPTSGKRRDIRTFITDKLTSEQIEVEFYETKRYMHAWEYAEKDIDFAQHSALIAVGGDGTLHEVINGMLMREDKRRLPIGFVPNGSGNDLVGCFGVRDIEQALDWFLKGDVIKMDVNKMLIDADDEEEIPPEEMHKRFRYSATSASLGFIAKVVHNAIRHKPYFGGASYVTSGWTSFWSNYADLYDINIQ